MKRLAVILVMLLTLTGCGSQEKPLVDMEGKYVEGDTYGIVWEGRTYTPFCVVEKKDCGEQIGYVNGDQDDRISTYRSYDPTEWIVSWMPHDGGAMLLKEDSVTEIPGGLEQEYD